MLSDCSGGHGFLCHWTTSWFNLILKSRKILDVPTMPTFLCSHYLKPKPKMIFFSLPENVVASVELEKGRWCERHHRQHKCVCPLCDCGPLGASPLGKLSTKNQGYPLLHCVRGSCGLVLWTQWPFGRSEHLQCKASLPVSPHSFLGKQGRVWHWTSPGHLCSVCKWELTGDCSGKQFLEIGSLYS